LKEFIHSVLLDKDKCMGCTNCIKRCPTQAIRVRDGKAHILNDRCIDCAECIRVCPHRAKTARTDPLSVLNDFEYKIALPAPSLYAQFNNLSDQSLVLASLLDIGFDAVFEVAAAAEIVSEATKEYLKRDDIPKPLISSACPAVTRLITVRYPSLIPHILPVIAPVELAARLAKLEAMEKTGLHPSRIGCIFISPCPAKITAIHSPIGYERSAIDVGIAANDVYPLLLHAMNNHGKVDPSVISAGRLGVAWGEIGGESEGLESEEQYLAADGIENIIKVLDDVESAKYSQLKFVELSACSAGCVGGVLQVENPYIAKVKLNTIKNNLPAYTERKKSVDMNRIEWERNIEATHGLELGDTAQTSIQRYGQVMKILEQLPGLDCGCCGAPTCEAFAEDIVLGKSQKNQCIVVMRRKLEQFIKIVTDSDSDYEKR